MKKITLFILIAGFFACGLAAQQPAAQPLIEVRRAIGYSIRDSVDYIGNQYISYWGQLPSVFSFVNSDGSVTICTSDDNAKITYIYEYDIDLQAKRALAVRNEIGSLGAFTKDSEGYYYFFYGVKTTNKNFENMAVIKYNPEGKKVRLYKLTAQAPNSYDGIKVPYSAGSCRLELSGSMLAVYFAREMFNGQQSSYGFVLDKDTFKRIDEGAATNTQKIGGNMQIPYVCHSFNQFILPIDNGFVFADHGDTYPRSFTFAKFQKGSNTKRLHAFTFSGENGTVATYAEMGGLAKTSNGYIFAGVYGKDRNSSRNLFVLTFDEDMDLCSDPIYLTKYTKNDNHAGHPKIVRVDTDRYLLLWEVFKFSMQSANVIERDATSYVSTYMLLINEKGEAVSEPRELNARLNMNDPLRYNSNNGRVYWVINNGKTSLTIYALKKEI